MAYKEAQDKVFQILGYKPTVVEAAVHNNTSRIKLIAGGGRAGKSMVNSKELISHHFAELVPESLGGGVKRDRINGLYWLLAKDYEGNRGEWEHLMDDFYKLECFAQPPTKNIDPGLMVLQDGTKIITKSAKYPETIATMAPNGILICEAAQVDYEAFLRARERIAERRGWLCLAGTFEKEEYVSWYRELYELGQSYNNLGLRSFSMPTWSNTVKFPGGRQDAEILKQEQGMTPERFQERFGGVPCPKTGRVITEFSNVIHVGKYDYNSDLPVEIAVDPGYGGAYVVLAIQQWGNQLAVVDEIYEQGMVTKDLILCLKQGYMGSHELPWFKAVTQGAIDIYAGQHQAMEAPIEIWRNETHIALCSKKIRNIEDGIDLLRTHMKVNPVTGRPGIIINATCRGLIAECGGGKAPIEGGGTWIRDERTLVALRKNDHACKALIYYLVNKFGYTASIPKRGPMKITRELTVRDFVRT